MTRVSLSSLRAAAGRRLLGDEPKAAALAELDPPTRRVVEAALPYTMTEVPRVAALVEAVRHCARRGIAGAFAECGVWRGGSVMAMIGALQELGAPEREIYLFDTFAGMTEPTEEDTSRWEGSAVERWRDAKRRGDRPWPELFADELVNEDAVRSNLLATGYPEARLHLVAGRVEDTIPEATPESLALLRLDTDFYASTLHELRHLYPRLVPGGVLIIDDYGHWEGARKAVDEYFSTEAEPLLLNRIDYTGRIAVKV